MVGVYYNTAAVIDADGSYLGKCRKAHIPVRRPGQCAAAHPVGRSRFLSPGTRLPT
jgi:predicted amidohydrolase